MKVMVISAHIDDSELLVGGLTAKLTAKGHQVTFVAMADGGMGHHLMSQEETEKRRHQEGLAAAKLLGANYEFMHFPECEIMPTIENRKALVAMIRKYSPDILITHPPCDYHADHKYTSELVADAAFMLQVPKFVPDTPPMRQMPYIFYTVNRMAYMDFLTPAWGIPIDDVMTQKFNALHCHTSQMYEWLPWTIGISDQVPGDEQARRNFLYNWRSPAYRQIADRYRDLLIQQYGESGRQVQFAEILFRSPLGQELKDNTCQTLFSTLQLP